MPKLLRSASVALAVTASVCMSTSAAAANGAINIKGAVASNTCVINGGQSPGKIDVPLPTVSVSALTRAGSTAGTTQFHLEVTQCNAMTSASVVLFGPASNMLADGNLKNATGNATNVEVQLIDVRGHPIDLSQAQLLGKALFGGTAALIFYAQYFATGIATAGTVRTSVEFSMIYQ